MPAMPSTDDGLTFSQAINPNNHGPYVTVTAALLFACSVLFYLFRVYTRWPIHRLFDLDDAATSVATVCHCNISWSSYTNIGLESSLPSVNSSQRSTLWIAAVENMSTVFRKIACHDFTRCAYTYPSLSEGETGF